MTITARITKRASDAVGLARVTASLRMASSEQSRKAYAGRNLVALGLSCTVGIPLPAAGGDWIFTPRLSTQETYTNNVLLSESGAEGDFISTIAPGLSIRGNSARLKSDIDYNLQQQFYGDKTELDATNHQLQALTEATLVERWLYLDITSRKSQQNVANRGVISRNNRGDDSNRRDVTSYEFVPRLEHTFGSWVNLLLSYSKQTIDQSGATGSSQFLGAGSSDEEGYHFEVGSGSRFGRFPLRSRFDSREVEFETGRINKFKRLSGEASYIWSRKFRFTATGGTENNEFISTQGNSDGPFWSIGGTWTPTSRTTVSGNWGDRFFGKTFNVAADHRMRRWIIGIDYSEDIRTSNQFERDLLLVPLLGPDGLPVFDPVTSSQLFVPIDSPSLTDDVFIERRISASIGYTMKRTSWSGQYFQNDREAQSVTGTELTRGVSIDVSHAIGPRLSADFGATWRENTLTTDQSKGSFYSLYPSLNYQLGPHTTARLQYELSYSDGSTGVGFGSGAGGLGGDFGGGLGGLGFGSEFDTGARTYTESAITAALIFHL